MSCFVIYPWFIVSKKKLLLLLIYLEIFNSTQNYKLNRRLSSFNHLLAPVICYHSDYLWPIKNYNKGPFKILRSNWKLNDPILQSAVEQQSMFVCSCSFISWLYFHRFRVRIGWIKNIYKLVTIPLYFTIEWRRTNNCSLKALCFKNSEKSADILFYSVSHIYVENKNKNMKYRFF